MSVHRREDRDGYVARWRDSEGRNRSRTFRTQREAKEFDREMKQLERRAREARAVREGLEAARESSAVELREMARMLRAFANANWDEVTVADLQVMRSSNRLADSLEQRAAAMDRGETVATGYAEPDREQPTNLPLIERAGPVLAEAASSPARVILFGSGARGDADPGSDLDFLVIEREMDDRVAEAVRLRRALGDIGVPVDVIVLDEALAERRGKVPGTMVYNALRDGRLIAES
jgi:predicted nucleotidyltransferase